MHNPTINAKNSFQTFILPQDIGPYVLIGADVDSTPNRNDLLIKTTKRRFSPCADHRPPALSLNA
jgi:hypothetical protein